MPDRSYAPNDEPRRDYARLRLGISAQLQTLDGPQRVRLMDLSQGGAHLVLSRPEPLKQAFLSWLGFEAFGDIVWQEGSEVGMRFDRPLTLGQLVETRHCAPSVVRDEEHDAQVAARAWVAGDGGGNAGR